jgi:hypothetical protein
MNYNVFNDFSRTHMNLMMRPVPAFPSRKYRLLGVLAVVCLVARAWVGTPAAPVEPPARAVKAPVGDLTNAYAFPVPFRPSPGGRITFINLPTEATIKIFDVAGVLQATLSETDGDGILRWDVTGDDGSPLDSDVFLYVIESGDQRKVGKLMVVR